LPCIAACHFMLITPLTSSLPPTPPTAKQPIPPTKFCLPPPNYLLPPFFTCCTYLYLFPCPFDKGREFPHVFAPHPSNCRVGSVGSLNLFPTILFKNCLILLDSPHPHLFSRRAGCAVPVFSRHHHINHSSHPVVYSLTPCHSSPFVFRCWNLFPPPSSSQNVPLSLGLPSDFPTCFLFPLQEVYTPMLVSPR